MKYLGWIFAGLFLIVIILNQFTIREYKLACKDYKKAIEIYEKKNTKSQNTETFNKDNEDNFIECILNSKEILVIEANGNIYGMDNRFIGKLNDEEKKDLGEIFFQCGYGNVTMK